MSHPILDLPTIEEPPELFLRRLGEIFAVFGELTQDSGNISYGVRAGEERYFVKTAGVPENPVPHLSHGDRVALLRNAVRLSRSSRHPALVPLRLVIESPHGPLLVYDWVDGELIGVRRSRREDPHSSFQRFRALPLSDLLRALGTIFELHHELAQRGWIAVDFYDGALIYDFSSRRLHVCDLDNYRTGPLVNEMGRMFGSSRFMAPEEFRRGAEIDQRTNVYTMGRTLAVFLSDGTLERGPFRGADPLHAIMLRACHEQPEERYPSMAGFWSAWCEARSV
jgi:serine/threonine-protein kinase